MPKKNVYPRIQPKQAPPVPQFLPPDPLKVLPAVGPALERVPLPNPFQVPVLMIPKEEKARWNISRLLDGVPMSGGFSYFDAFVAATLARAAYTDDEEVHDQLRALLEAAGYERKSYTVGDVAVVWDEYKTAAGTIVAIPGTTSFSQWVSYLKPFMKQDGLAEDVYVYQGVRQYLDAYVTKLDAVYGDDFYFGGQGKTMVCGHSLGGAIAYWYGFRKNVLNAETLAQYGRVKTVFTFGAPAFMRTDSPDRVMTGGMRVVRTVNPGDPIPNIVQQADARIRQLSTLTSLFLDAPPVHYATHSYLVDGRVPKQTQFFAALDALRKGLIQSTAEHFRPHKIAEYCRAIERSCLDNGDVPWPWFTYVVGTNRLLNSIGK